MRIMKLTLRTVLLGGRAKGNLGSPLPLLVAAVLPTLGDVPDMSSKVTTTDIPGQRSFAPESAKEAIKNRAIERASQYVEEAKQGDPNAQYLVGSLYETDRKSVV